VNFVTIINACRGKSRCRACLTYLCFKLGIKKFRMRSRLFRLLFFKHCVVPALCVGATNTWICFSANISVDLFLKCSLYSRLLCGGGLNVDAGGQLTTG
jgi:hypothetical protein